MSGGNEIQVGSVSETNWKFEWKIDNFMTSIRKGPLYRSPDFHVGDTIWYLKLGIRRHQQEKYIALFLYTEKIEKNRTVYFKFGLKTVYHDIVNELGCDWVPNGEDWGWNTFLKFSDLESRQSELLPLGTMTVVCFMMIKSNIPDCSTGLNKLSVDLKNVFASKKNTDITIKVKEETFSAHRLILAARSPVLAAMFENEMIEQRTGFIDILDCDPAAFKHFLHYLYSGKLGSGECDFFDLYKIADKYNVCDLKVMCTGYINHNLSRENFCETYAFAHHFSDHEFLTQVQNFFHENFEEIVSSESFLSLMQEDCSLAHNILKTMASKVTIINNP